MIFHKQYGASTILFTLCLLIIYSSICCLQFPDYTNNNNPILRVGPESRKESSQPFEFIDFVRTRGIGITSAWIPDPIPNSEIPQNKHYILGISDESGASLIRFNVLDYNGTGVVAETWTQRLFFDTDEEFIDSMVLGKVQSDSAVVFVVTRYGYGYAQERRGPIVVYIHTRKVIKILVTKVGMYKLSTWVFQHEDKRRFDFAGVTLLPNNLNSRIAVLFQTSERIPITIQEMDSDYMTSLYPMILLDLELPLLRKEILIANSIAEYFYLLSSADTYDCKIHAISKLSFAASSTEVYAEGQMNPISLIYSESETALLLLASTTDYVVSIPTTLYHFLAKGADLTLINVFNDTSREYTIVSISADHTNLKLLQHTGSQWLSSQYNIRNKTMVTSDWAPSSIAYPPVSVLSFGNDSFVAVGAQRTGYNVMEYIQTGQTFSDSKIR
jgi:hypothetical protein